MSVPADEPAPTSARLDALQRIMDFSVRTEDPATTRPAGYTVESLDADIELLARAYQADPERSREIVETAAEVLQEPVYIDVAAPTRPARPEALWKRGMKLEAILRPQRGVDRGASE
jgi:hypothetical protein